MAITRDKALKAEKTFRIAAYITGGMLLLLTAEMVLKYAFGVEIEAGGPFGFLALVPTDTTVAINISTWILIVHGWLYVLYLYAAFRIWTETRWSFLRFVIIAAGGVVPFLSFFTERHFGRLAKGETN
jgi:integral membrane protein